MKCTLNLFLRIIALVLIITNTTTIYAQRSKSKQSSTKSRTATMAVNPQTVLATVGDENITIADVESAFRRNMNRKNIPFTDVRRDSVFNFLDLYIKYRLKVKDAIARGIDKEPQVLAEVANNRKMLSETFLFDKKIIEPNLEHYLQNRKKEIKVGVIVTVSQQTTSEFVDTARAYKKIVACLELLQKGVPFEQLARDSSEDNVNKSNGGVLGYLTSLNGIVKPLEDVAFSLKPGEYNKNYIRLRYAYIIVKNLGEQPRYAIKSRQILLTYNTPQDSIEVNKKADSLITILRSKPPGVFADMAREFSKDKSSGANGGEVGGWYTRSMGFVGDDRKLLPAFEDKMFSIKPGEIAKVITDYGLHIIRVDSIKQFTSDEEKEPVKKAYKKLFFEEDKRAFLEKSKSKSNYAISETVFEKMLTQLDTKKNVTDTAFTANLTDDIRRSVIYNMNGKTLSVSALIDSLRKRNDLRGMTPNKTGIGNALTKISDDYIVVELASKLEAEYPDFAALMKDFRDGILLFKVEEQEVWGKMKFDSTLAKKYYDSTRTKYLTDYRYDLTEVFLQNKTEADLLAAQQKNSTRESFEELASTTTQRTNYREKRGRWGLVSVKTNKLAMVVDSLKPVSNSVVVVPFERGYSVVRINETQPPRSKTFEEAIPDFAPQFQDMMQRRLSDQWLASLRAKYPVNIDIKALEKSFPRTQ